MPVRNRITVVESLKRKFKFLQLVVLSMCLVTSCVCLCYSRARGEQNMKKSKKDRKSGEVTVDQDKSEAVAGFSDNANEEEIVYVSPIAQPMASSKVTKKIRKLIKAGLALNEKTYVRNGLRDVQSSIRKKERGLVIFAGDVTPIEVMCHLPGVCEELDIPYIYVNSRQVLGSALGIKRGSLMVLLKRHETYGDLYDEVVKVIDNLPPPWS